METWKSAKFTTFTIVLSTLFTTTFSFCPQYCACNDTSLSVSCHSASNLRVVPIVLNPLIKSLTLSPNQIKDITLSLQFYPELSYLDISGNQIPTLGKGNFESLRALEFLNVSYNQVKALESGVFQGLGTLNVLDLTGNQVERVESDVFWGLKNVKEIILDRNRLEFIDWDLFRGLDNLVKISVQYNFIQVIEPSIQSSGTPWTLKNLQFLDVSSNQLTRVKDNSLLVFSYLKELNLCCNYIHTLEDKAFTGLNTLQSVNLSQNRLGRVPTTSLQSLSNSLRKLDLSSNRLSNILPSNAFHSLLQLQVLRINDNPNVLGFHPDSLSEQLNLLNFEADYLPNLTDFSASLLNNKPNLKRFSVKYAQISVLPFQLVEDLGDSTAMSLDVTGNPVECNCSAYPLFQYLQHYAQQHGDNQEDLDFLLEPLINTSHTHQPYIGNSHLSFSPSKKKSKPFFLASVRCQGPNEFAGILVKDLKQSDFGECFTKEDDFQVLVVIIAGVVVSVIFLLVGVKLCCFSGGRRCSCSCPWGKGKSEGDEKKRFCCGKCPCFNRAEKELDLDKCDRLFEGFRREMPNNNGQMQIQQNPFVGVQVQQSPNGKLFFSADNSTPSHQPHPQSYFHQNGFMRGSNSGLHSPEENFLPPQNYTIRLQPHPQKYQKPPPPQSLPPTYTYTFNPKTSCYQNNYSEDEGNEYDYDDYDDYEPRPPKLRPSKSGKYHQNRHHTLGGNGPSGSSSSSGRNKLPSVLV